MTRRLCRWGLVLVLAAAAAHAAPPARFPDVPLSPGSRPMYAFLGADSWTNRIAYVLFDGNLSNGYSRAYVWAPDFSRYEKPLLLKRVDERGFEPFSIVSTNGEGLGAAVTWSLAWSVETHGRAAGSHQVFDYVTGQMKTVNVPAQAASSNVVFGYRLNYRQGPPMAVGSSGPVPLELNTSGRLGVLAVWSNIPSAGVSPWRGVSFSMAPKLSHERAGPRLAFTCVVSGGGNPLQFVSMPESSEVTLMITPYMEKPVVSNTVSAAEAFSKGMAVDVPYGWYNNRFLFRCPGLGVFGGGSDLYPIARPGQQPGS